MNYEYCLCSGAPLVGEEKATGWKRSCVLKMFGRTELPVICLDDPAFLSIAQNQLSNGRSVTGVQKKISLGFSSSSRKQRLTVIDHPAGYILKPQSEIPFLPEAENLVMQMADIVGIQTPTHGLIPLGDGTLAYITKRMDRDGNRKTAMEDFCQLSLHLTEDKYLGSYESLKSVIAQYSSIPKLDMVEFFYRIVFCFLTLNSDMHRKNFSLIEKEGRYALSPAYDLLPVNFVFPSDTEETALTLHGKKKGVTRKDFIEFACQGEGVSSIPKSIAEKLIQRLLAKKEELYGAIDRSYLDAKGKSTLKKMMSHRFSRLSR